jgi:hypothetical protein
MTLIPEQLAPEFTLSFDGGDPAEPPFPDCHCGRWVGDECACSGCNLHPLDCPCLPVEDDNQP